LPAGGIVAIYAHMNIQDLIERSPIGRWRERHPLVPVVRLYGVIAPGSRPMQPSLSLASTATAIEQAFAVRGARAVALAVNSPGGSPVQSALIHDRIRLLAAEKEIPVYVFCEDVAASGGYWIACAGDEIWANESSIVGSIGVISAGFGFEDLIRKLGIERRLHTSGEKKSMLDPFGPEKEADVKRLGALQKEIHDAFKAHVRARRGERLQAGDRKLFSGEFWTGAAAQKLGLVDGIGDMKTVLRRKFGDKVRLKLVGHRQPWLRRRLGLSGIAGGEVGGLGGLGGSFAGSLVASLEERAHWQRFGL
jgi:signal peptide peptidase SppA